MPRPLSAGLWSRFVPRTEPARPARRRQAGQTRPGLEALEAKTLLTAGLVSYSGPFDIPVALATGSDGNLWVLNSGGKGDSSLVVIAPGGSVEATYPLPTPGASAGSLALGPDGDLWFVETGSDKIGKVTPSGAITEYAVPPTAQDFGPGIGRVDVSARLTDIVAGPDGALRFADGSGEIGSITTDGVITETPTPGLQPQSLAVGADHAVWFTDTTDHNTVDRLNADGTLSTFRIPTDFAWPTSLTAGPDGALWFVESLNHAVGRVTTDGAVTEMPVRADIGSPQHLTFDAEGNLWVSGSGGVLARVTPQGLTTPFGAAPGGSNGALDAGSGADITTGPDGAIWVTGPDRGAISRIDPAGIQVAATDHPLSGSAPNATGLSVSGLDVSGALAGFDDGNPAGTAADFSAEVRWGDGSASAGIVQADGSIGFRVSGGHTYAQDGTYTITVTVTDVNPAHTPRPNTLNVTTSLDVVTPTFVPPVNPVGPPILPPPILPPSGPVAVPVTASPVVPAVKIQPPPLLVTAGPASLFRAGHRHAPVVNHGNRHPAVRHAPPPHRRPLVKVTRGPVHGYRHR